MVENPWEDLERQRGACQQDLSHAQHGRGGADKEEFHLMDREDKPLSESMIPQVTIHARNELLFH